MLSKSARSQRSYRYIPDLIQQFIFENSLEKDPSLPFLQSLNTVVMFADIRYEQSRINAFSGFTMISEHCAKMGARGSEDLAFVINRYMEGIL